MRRLLASLTLIAIGIAPANQARAAACPAADPVTVNVELRFPEPRIRDDVGFAGIARLGRDAYRPAGAESMHTVGLTRTRLDNGVSFLQSYVTANGRVCGRVQNVNATLTVSDLTVFIARELRADDCARETVYRHEMEHVAIDRRTLHHLRPQVKAYLADAADRLGPVQGRTVDAVQAQTRRYLQTAVDQITDEIDRHRADGHARLDTLEEYRRLSRACGGRIAKRLAQHTGSNAPR